MSFGIASDEFQGFQPSRTRCPDPLAFRGQAGRRHAGAGADRRFRRPPQRRQRPRAATPAGPQDRRTARARAAIARRARCDPPRRRGRRIRNHALERARPDRTPFRGLRRPARDGSGRSRGQLAHAARPDRGASSGAHARRLHRQCESRIAHAAGVPARLHRNAAGLRPCGCARQREIPGHHARARPPHGAPDRRLALALAHRAEAACAPRCGGRSEPGGAPCRRYARAASQGTRSRDQAGRGRSRSWSPATATNWCASPKT